MIKGFIFVLQQKRLHITFILGPLSLPQGPHVLLAHAPCAIPKKKHSNAPKAALDLMHAMIDKHQQDVLRMGYLHVYLLLQYNQLVLYFAIIQSIHRSTSSSLCCWKILFWALLHSTYRVVSMYGTF